MTARVIPSRGSRFALGGVADARKGRWPWREDSGRARCAKGGGKVARSKSFLPLPLLASATQATITQAIGESLLKTLFSELACFVCSKLFTWRELQ